MFTAIVTSFVLDSMSELEGDSDPSPLIIYVNALWFMSITLSLGASTWAMLCQEWCASHLQGEQPGDYVEMATKRQRSLEAIKKWKMATLVTTIPFFLHIALFLFLAGLSLRLADKNRALGFVVGIPSAVIITTYIISTLLPVFTDAPFYTTASELIELVLSYFKHPPRFPQILWPLGPNLPPGILSFPQRMYCYTVVALKQLIPPIIAALRQIYLHSTSPFLSIWQRIFAFLPRFKFEEGDLLGELNQLVIEPPEQNLRWRGRALFWLLQMPLNQEEFNDVLKELNKIPRGGDGYAVDQQSIESLMLRLSSVLSDGHISPEEEPVTLYCLRVLARALDYAFFAPQNREPVTLKNKTISETLDQFLDRLADDHGNGLEDFLVPLWFSPTKSRVHRVITCLGEGAGGVSGDLLMSAVHGLHAAMLSLLKSKEPITELLIPDILSWDRETVLGDLGQEIFAYLHDLFGALDKSSSHQNKTVPLPTLVIKSLQLLDEDEELSQPLLNPLCTFIIIGQGVDPSVAAAMLASVMRQSESIPITEKTLVQLTNKLETIVYGSVLPIQEDFHPLTGLRTVFGHVIGGPDKDEGVLAHFIQQFLDAYTIIMRNMDQCSDEDTSFLVKVSQNEHVQVAVSEHQECHLSLLYSLTSAFLCAREPWPIIGALYQLGEFLMSTKSGGDHTDQVMDTFFNAVVLQVIHHQNLNALEAEMDNKGKGREEPGPEPKPEVEMEAIRGAKVALSWLKGVLFTENNQIWWKGIYLLAELAGVVDSAELEPACNHIRSDISTRIQPARAWESLVDLDSDEKLREWLRSSNLEEVIGSLPYSSLVDCGKDKTPLLLSHPKFLLLDLWDKVVYSQPPTLQRFVTY